MVSLQSLLRKLGTTFTYLLHPFNQITIYVSAKGVDLSDFPRFGLVEVSESSLPVDFDIESKLLQTYIYKTQNNPSDASGPYIQYEVLWAGDGTNTAVIQDPNSDPGTLSVNAVGPVILKVSLDDPEGNYSATSAIRVLEIIEGPGDTDNTDPTDNTPVVDYNPPATPTPSTPPSGTPDPLISGQSLDGTNWYYLDWFGFYYMDPADNGWIYHVEHGWLWASGFQQPASVVLAPWEIGMVLQSDGSTHKITKTLRILSSTGMIRIREFGTSVFLEMVVRCFTIIPASVGLRFLKTNFH